MRCGGGGMGWGASDASSSRSNFFLLYAGFTKYFAEKYVRLEYPSLNVKKSKAPLTKMVFLTGHMNRA